MGVSGMASPINWIAQYPMQVVIFAKLLTSIAYGTIIFSSAIKAIPENQFKAARVDGAKEWEIVKAIILPNLRFHIMFIALWDTLGLLTDYVNIMLITDGGPGKASEVISPEFKEAGHSIRLVSCDPHDTAALTANYDAVLSAIRAGKVVSAWALGLGGVAEGLFKMGIGNQIGTRIDDDYDGNLFAQQMGAMLLECAEDIDLGVKVGDTVTLTIYRDGKTFDVKVKLVDTNDIS